MSKDILWIGLIASMLAACDVKQSEEFRQVASERDSLEALVREREMRLEELAQSFDDIEQNLAALERVGDTLIDLHHEGRRLDQKTRILQMIDGIDGYINESRRQLAELEARIAENGTRSQGLQRLVARLRANIDQKETQMNQLVAELSDLTEERDELRRAVASRDARLAQREADLRATSAEVAEKEAVINTAYFLAGTRKQLAESGVIKKEGGVLGIGRTVKLADKQDTRQFNKLNIAETREIYIGYLSKPRVISNHPTDSYLFAKSNDMTKIRILNPEKFWSVSKFLVVEIDD